MTTAKQPDLIDAVVRDHRAAEALFAEIEAGGDARVLVGHVIAELTRHAVAEETYLYPIARDVLPDGDELADHEIAEHAQAELIMVAIERAGPDDPEFGRLVADLVTDTRLHMRDEETDLLPRLRAVCDPGLLGELGRRFAAPRRGLSPRWPGMLVP